MHRSDSVSSLSSKSSTKGGKAKKVKKPDVDLNGTKPISETVSAFRTGPTLLRPTRQASKNAVLNIMDRNEVVLELIKVKKNQQYIMEVIRIESEIDNIIVYQPNGGKGCIISNRPPPVPTEKGSFMQFNYKNLPQNYWKKYDLAAKFVKMVRSRTPKITLHVEDAKCILYDTSPDFEAHFHRGTKFHISKEGTIKITHTDGTSLSLESSSRSTCLSPDIQEMLEKSHKWHNYCLEEEKLREKRQEIYKDIVQFPLTIGRRIVCSSASVSHKLSSSVTKQQIQREKSLDSDFDYSKLANTTQNQTNISNISNNYSANFKQDHPVNHHNFHDLKSASTSSLNNNSVLSNNNSDSLRLNHSYQNSSHPLNHTRLRNLNAAYDSQSSSPLQMSLNNNPNTCPSLDQASDHQNQQYNHYNQNFNRPNSSSSSSSSHNYSNPISTTSQQYQYIQHQNMQIKTVAGRQLLTPSPTTLVNAMQPLSLVHGGDSIPVSLPQRENYKYYNS